MPDLNSCIYEGTVSHQRLTPSKHDFSYQACMLYLDIDEIPTILKKTRFFSYQKPNLMWFNREDYIGAQKGSIREAINEIIFKKFSRTVQGPIRLLSHVRTFGFVFNPVTFYYCFDNSEQLEYIVAEIENTPWGQRFTYVLPITNESASCHRFRFQKDFHVSPFLPMDMEYYWMFTDPKQLLNCRMYNFKQGSLAFSAQLTLKRVPLRNQSLNRIVFKYPLITWQVLLRIYWQALRLYIKKVPVFDHPDPKNRKSTPFF
ncbi:MAG: DUF1365 domain-containing protein [Oligoflexales bacterium]